MSMSGVAYLFESESGERIERRFSIMGEIPSHIEEGGVVYRRIFTVPQIIWNAPGFTQRAEGDLINWQRTELDKY